jgi:hypothetical protein
MITFLFYMAHQLVGLVISKTVGPTMIILDKLIYHYFICKGPWLECAKRHHEIKKGGV